MDKHYEINIELKEFNKIKSVLNNKINKIKKQKKVTFDKKIHYKEFYKTCITGSLF